MKKLLILVIPILLFVAQTIFRLPAVSTWLNLSDPYSQIGIALLLILLFVANQSIFIYRPFRRFQRFEKAKSYLLEWESGDLIQEYRKHRVEIRINVMLLTVRMLSMCEPRSGNAQKRKLTVWKKHFRMIWSSSTMEQAEDRGMLLSIDQGVCGEAARSGGLRLADLTVTTPATYNLTESQLRKTRNVKFVLSCPIRELDEETLRTKARIIGVVSFDSTSNGSEKCVNNKELLEDITRKILAFSELCSYIY